MAKSSAKTVRHGRIEHSSLASFVEQSYLDYSMYVILDRALPSICDGLKPVQRRIVYAMSELSLTATAKPKKSARTIGDVIGKYHPHGEVACYEAMVLMSQVFAYRYPLIEGQGNWGSIDDPKSFAAMRYTEARLTPYAAVLLDELGQGTVAWRKNFDGTLDEPEVLPAQLPNLLLNGAAGIAIGMSTDIPPHNLNEVCQACCLLLDKARTSLKEITKIIKGPDFPSGGEIVSSQEALNEIYRTGSGSIRLRACYKQEKNNLVITSLPYQTSVARVMHQIQSLTVSGKLNLIKDLLDESDEDNEVRIVIQFRHTRIKAKDLMAYLFAHTDLERNQRIHLNIIGLDRKPEVKPLIPLLHEWLDFRCETVRKRLQARIAAIAKQLEILDGFKIVFARLEEVIKVIRTADLPKQALIKKFKLTELQAESILEMRLRRLAKLEQTKIEAQYKQLSKEKAMNETYLSSKRRLKTLVKKEIKANQALYGDTRRSRLVSTETVANAIDKTQFIAEEKYTLAVSRMGWVRVMHGHQLALKKNQFQCRSGDEWIGFFEASNKQSMLLLDTTGRCYTLSLSKLEVTRTEQPLSQLLNVPEGAHFVGVVLASPEQVLVIGSTAGYALRAPASALLSNRREGKQILSLKSTQAEAVGMVALPQDFTQALIAAVNRTGQILTVSPEELPLLEKGKGRMLLRLDKKKFARQEEAMIALVCMKPGDTLCLHAGKKSKKVSYEALAQSIGKCAQRGLKFSKVFKTIDKVNQLGE